MLCVFMYSHMYATKWFSQANWHVLPTMFLLCVRLLGRYKVPHHAVQWIAQTHSGGSPEAQCSSATISQPLYSLPL